MKHLCALLVVLLIGPLVGQGEDRAAAALKKADQIVADASIRVNAISTRVDVRINNTLQNVDQRLEDILAKYDLVLVDSSNVAYVSSYTGEFLPENFGKPAPGGNVWVGEIAIGYIPPLNEPFTRHIRTVADVQAFIVWESVRVGFPPEVALAIARSESSFHWWAVSHTGATGVFQFVKSTWRETNRKMGRTQYEHITHRSNSRLNIEAALWLLKRGEFYHWQPYSGGKWVRIKNKYKYK